jgi:membrane protein DedA with SNARE-associated domain
VQNALAPVVAGIAAGLLALPLVAFLPLVGAGTAVSLGLAVGLGVAAGAREVRGTLPRY